MLLISRLRCREESQSLTLLLQGLGRKELEQLFPTEPHLYFIILTIGFFWLVLCILILHIAYNLYGCMLILNLKF